MSDVNPFTDKPVPINGNENFLDKCYNDYNNVMNNSELLDDTEAGELVIDVTNKLLAAVDGFLDGIGRSDFLRNNFDWEIHLIRDSTVNAWCMPGGKMAVYSGMLGPIQNEEDLALIIGHEMSHALCDHTLHRINSQNTKNALTTAAYIGAVGLSLFGLGEVASVVRTVTTVADIGSEYLILKPFDRDQEFEADKLGMTIMQLAGYDVTHVPDFWRRVSAEGPNEFDFLSTHPADSKRIAKMEEFITSGSDSTIEYENTKRCPNCGAIVGNGDVFCTACGKKVSSVCSNCGSSINDGDIFCTVCGEKIGNVCPSCGNPVSDGDIFCTVCGARI